MEIETGLVVASVGNPAVRWGASIAEIQRVLESIKYHKHSNSYLCTELLSVDDIDACLGLHFERDRLSRIEVLTRPMSSIRESFNRNQAWLERQFGQPLTEGPADAGFHYYGWSVGRVRITHTVIDRFIVGEQVVFDYT